MAAKKTLKINFETLNKDTFKEFNRDEMSSIVDAASKRFEEIHKDLNVERMRTTSGEVTDDSSLVCFLYLLMRDVATPGHIEKIMLNFRNLNDKRATDGPYRFTNGWLAGYAQDVAKRLIENDIRTGETDK